MVRFEWNQRLKLQYFKFQLVFACILDETTISDSKLTKKYSSLPPISFNETESSVLKKGELFIKL